MSEKELKHYFKQIKLLLPLYRQKEKRFMKDLKFSVNEFVESNSDCTLDDITERFDSPQEIVNNYLTMVDTAYLCKQISIRRMVKRTFALIIILTFLAFCIYAGMIYKIYHRELNQIITQEVTVISIKVTPSGVSKSTAWKVSNISGSKSGNKARATATGKHYVGGVATSTKTKSVTLTCSPTGQFS